MDGGKLVGILSERDLAHGIADHGDKLADMKVRDHMTRNVATCLPDDSTSKLMAVMTERRFRHLPVVVDGELKGMISIGDVVKSRLEEFRRELESLKEYVGAHEYSVPQGDH